MPGNFDAPSHALLREVAAASPRADELTPLLRGGSAVEAPATYAATLARLGCRIDVWETTYLHVLDPEGAQESPVLEWTKGTALRPVLQVLTDERERAAFLVGVRAAAPTGLSRGPFGRSSRSVGSSPSPSVPGNRPERARLPATGSAARSRVRRVGLASRPDRPFHARLTRCAATSSFLNLRASSHHWPVSATMPTSIWA